MIRDLLLIGAGHLCGVIVTLFAIGHGDAAKEGDRQLGIGEDGGMLARELEEEIVP